ncbi:MAG: putative Ig domain-containing protein [Brevundimonas sp.]
MGKYGKASTTSARISMALGLTLVATTLQVAAPMLASANPAGTHLVINEFSGGNGAGTAATDEYVELYNPTSQTITFTGTIQYKSATGSTYTAVSPVTTFVVAPHGYWLAAGVNYSGPGTPDSRYSFDASASTTAGGHIALTGATTGVTTPANDPLRVDLLGYGTANSPETSAAPSHPAVGGALRRTNGRDTDNNSVDFVQAPRAPRTSAQNGTATLANPGNQSFTVDEAITPIALTAAGGVPPYTYAVSAGSLPAGIALNATTGQITGTPTTAAPATDVTVRATDKNGDPVFATFTITVASATSALTLTAPDDQSLTVGTAASPFSFAATGGTAPYSYAVTAGGLPSGLALGANTGTISGTPAEVWASSAVTVTATDAGGRTAEATFSLSVAPGTIDSATPSVDDTKPVVGDVLTATPGAWSPASATLAYQWLADGRAIEDATGASLTVTDDLVGAVLSVRVTGTKAGYTPASATSSGTTAVVAAVTVTSPGTQSLTVGEAVTPFSFATSGGVAPYTYAVTSGTLPSGLTLDTDTGEVSGTPSAATAASDVTVTATDADGSTGSALFSVGVGLGSLTWSTPTIDDRTPVVGEYVSVDPGTWGPAPVALTYEWFADDDLLATEVDTHLLLTANMVGKAISVRVTGTKAEHRSAAARSLATAPVVAPVMLANPGAVILKVGTPITPVRVAARGGVAPYTYAVTAGTLPAGLELDTATGEISGTPTAVVAGSGVTVTAAAADGHFGSTSFYIEARPGTLTAATPVIEDTTPVVGDVLTADAGVWGPEPVALSYQWLADGEELELATSATLEVTPDLAGSVLSVRVTGTKAEYATASRTSAGTSAVLPAVTVTAPGTTHLTVDTAVQDAISFSATGGVAPYAYAVTSGALPDGLALDPDTGTISGTPTTASDASSVTVTVEDADGHTRSASFTVDVAPGTLNSDSPTIDDTTPVVGDVLTADPGVWGPAPVTLAYQWLAGGQPIDGEDATTLAVTSDLVGAVLAVRVSASKAQYWPATATSSATAAVTAPPLPPQPQSLTLRAPARALVGADVPVTAAASSGLPATLSLASGACTLNPSGRLTAASPTTCVVRAGQDGDLLWLPATPAQHAVVFVAPAGDSFTVDGASASGPRPLLDVLRNDPSALTLTAAAGAAHGSVTVAGTQVRYLPASGYRGTDSFTYTVRDENGFTAHATVSLTVRNAAPMLATTRTAQTAGTSRTVTPSALDPNHDALALTVTSRPAHVGARVVGGTVVLTPDRTVSGRVSVGLRVTDGAGGSATATVQSLVTPVAVASATRELIKRGTRVRWAKAATADARYEVRVDGKRVCITAKRRCIITKRLGPDQVVTVRVLGRDRTVSAATTAGQTWRHSLQIATARFRAY